MSAPRIKGVRRKLYLLAALGHDPKHRDRIIKEIESLIGGVEKLPTPFLPSEVGIILEAQGRTSKKVNEKV